MCDKKYWGGDKEGKAGQIYGDLQIHRVRAELNCTTPSQCLLRMGEVLGSVKKKTYIGIVR